jgi:hypothetical protein
MRVRCDACGHPQPPGGSAGDLCTRCGQAVRRERRCYWCAKWIPEAKYCRSCGAETVKPALYGAARMLKEAGSDRFTLPKQLRAFDRDRLENFSRIYERHAAVAARHVDDVRFLERHLHRRHWSAVLEDELVAQLPWPEETLRRLDAAAAPALDGLPAAKALGERSPFPLTRQLAALVRLALDDFTAHAAAVSVFRSSEPPLRAEAALVLTGWRVLWSAGRPRGLERELLEELRGPDSPLAAAVGRGFLGDVDPDRLREALAAPDPRLSLGAALVLGDVDRLRSALDGDPLERRAAGAKLVELGVIRPVVEAVERSPLEVQRELVESLARRKTPVPEAEETLLGIAESTEDETLRYGAVRVLCRRLRPEWALRLARAARGESSIYQSILQAEGLTPEAAVEMGDFLLREGRFTRSQYGLSALAERGTMPADFVSSRFDRAPREAREELLRFAELQLGRSMDEALHRFLLQTAFGPHDAKLRAAAWWVLRRTYRARGDVRGEGPFRLRKEEAERAFGSLAAFLPRLAAVLRDPDTMKEVGYFEMLAHLLGSADDGAVVAIREAGGAGEELLDALLEAAGGPYWPSTVEAAITLASRIAAVPALHARALERLRLLPRKGNYAYDRALRRLELAAFGLPEESEWSQLPETFVLARFRKASREEQRELLKIADHQLVHHKEETQSYLLPLLLEVALRPGDPELRVLAMAMHADRARGPFGRFALRREAVEHGYGSYEGFLKLLPGALRDPGGALDFLGELFGQPRPGDAEELAAAGEPGRAVIRAMLDLIGGPEEPGTQDLRRRVLRHLERSGRHPTWREEVAAGLDRVAPDLRAEAARIRSVFRPEPPPAPPPDPAPEPPAVDWAAKQRTAEKLSAELQEEIIRIMAGSGTPDEKARETMRLSREFQARMKDLYA